MTIRRCIILTCLFLPTSLFAQPSPNDVFVRVVDSGAALCCVVKMPGNRFMIYDAGNYSDGGSLTFNKVQEIIPLNSDIELMALSHSDSDHLGAVDEICANYDVKRVLRPGYKRDSATWRDANDAIIKERDNHGCIDLTDACRLVLRTYQDAVCGRLSNGGIADPNSHHLGLQQPIRYGIRGRNAALLAIDMAAAAGLRHVAIEGIERREVEKNISYPGLLNYLAPEFVGAILRHAARKGIYVHPVNVVDTETVARNVWSSLTTARHMGLALGKYGTFPLTLEDIGTAALSLEGVKFADGILFVFPNISLPGNGYVVIVKKQAARPNKFRKCKSHQNTAGFSPQAG